ncbi:hypothetical protein [Rhizorhabdus dicambivorans]|uniref:Uncharacterized protein n=1 Tax=Rhizorhabdus dicambivorans TaxID=1850238 RepID=A0A2A4FPM7_9SPHN|nr:hypothetical protein [Rhizorhabdus dicambivorans]ATE66395.1 hypothetical protein CMV14_19950 [Rhizorhabdus dicambivorans]PCE40363.1 hypothetical protein COO09_20495 [Rhizorhabdus dicambivorans]
MSYIIRFDGIGATSVWARDPYHAIRHAELFERIGKTNIVVGPPDGEGLRVSEFRKRHRN